MLLAVTSAVLHFNLHLQGESDVNYIDPPYIICCWQV
jgi:hypothetical protein